MGKGGQAERQDSSPHAPTVSQLGHAPSVRNAEDFLAQCADLLSQGREHISLPRDLR